MQIHRQFRKPLIVFSPKNLLRHPKCKSPLSEFDDVPDDQVGDTADSSSMCGVAGLSFFLLHKSPASVMLAKHQRQYNSVLFMYAIFRVSLVFASSV